MSISVGKSVPDSELKMSGVDAALLVITRSIASELENFRDKVFKDGSKVDWRG